MSQSDQPINDLCPADQAMLDRLIAAGFDLSKLGLLTEDERRRATAMMSLFSLLEDYPVEDADEDLVHATLARVRREQEQRAERMRLSPAADGRRSMRLIRLPDFISVAAVLLIAAGVAWPVLNRVRALQHEMACEDNLRMVGQAFTSYAADYDNSMPVSFAAGIGGGWDTARNIDHLAPLIERGYCDHGHFNCPGHSGGGPSYSYQLQMPGNESFWGLGRSKVVLGDRNPLIDAARAQRSSDPFSVSLNHAQRGQNVLQQDGSTLWLTTPTIGSDNIWLPSGIIMLRPGDRPREQTDIFLAH